MLPPAAPSPSPFLTSAPQPSASSSDIPPLPFLANSNRNKKRDFKKAMATAVGQKTVFAQSSPSDAPIYSAVPPPPPPPATPSRVQSLQRSDSATSTPTSGGKRPYQHVLAPSERTTLPKNMFVTSVDVETEEWEAQQGWGVEEVEPVGKGKKNGKAEGGGQGQQGKGKGAEGGNGGDRRGREENGADGSREWADYIRAEEQATAVGGKVASVAEKEINWETVDAAFKVARPVSTMSQLTPGVRVGWKVRCLPPPCPSPFYIR